MPPQEQVIRINIGQYICGGIIISCSTAQVKLRQLRGEIVQFFPFRKRLAGLGEVVCGVNEQIVFDKSV